MRILSLLMVMAVSVATLFTCTGLPIFNKIAQEGIWVRFLNLPMLLLFWALLTCYAIIYAKLYRQEFRKIFSFLGLIGLLLPAAYFLVELRLNLNKNNPFLDSRPFFLYTGLYFIFGLSPLGIIAGKIFRLLCKGEYDYFLSGSLRRGISRWILYSPAFVIFGYSVFKFMSEGDYLSSVLILSVFFISALSDFPKLFNKIGWLKPGFLKNDLFLMIIIFLSAFIVRYIWGLRLLSVTGERFLFSSDDGIYYGPIAEILARGGNVPESDGAYLSGIGYWYFLSLIYRFFGDNNYNAIIFIQAIVGSTIPVSIYYISRIIFNRAVALFAALFCVLNVNLIFLSEVVGMEALFIPLFLTTMCFVVKIFKNTDNKKWLFFLLLGLIFGLTFSARQEILLFPIVILIFMVVYLRKQMRLRKIINFFLAFTLGMSLVMFLIIYHNYRSYKKVFLMTTLQSAATFRGGYGSEETTILDGIGFNPFRNPSTSLKVFVDNPKRVSILLAKSFYKKGTRYLFYRNFGIFDPVTIVNPTDYYSRYGIYLAFYAFFFTIFGIILSLRRKEYKFCIRLIIVYILYTFCLYAILKASNARHRGVLEPFFLMFMAYGIYRFYGWVKTVVNTKIKDEK